VDSAFSQLGLKQIPEFADFVQLFRDWPSLSADEQQQFQQCRFQLVRSVSGAYFKGGHEITTSGYSTGARKTYRWGPAFSAAFNFTEWTRHEPYGPRDRKAIIRVMPGGVPVVAGDVEGMRIFNALSADLLTTSRKIFRHYYSGRTCWLLIPSYAQALIDHAPQVFDEIDPERNYFEGTGEPASREMRKFFSSRGLLYQDCMRSWMGGVTFLTCPHGNQHFLDFMSTITTEPVGGELVELVTTDPWNLAQPFINFPTGDVLDWSRRGTCACGYPIDDFEVRPRSPVMTVRGFPLRLVDLAAILGNMCQRVLGLAKICTSFCLENDTMFVDLVVNGTLQGANVGLLEQEFSSYLGMPCVIQERLSASRYKVNAIRQAAG